jgi:hypothetical protein
LDLGEEAQLAARAAAPKMRHMAKVVVFIFMSIINHGEVFVKRLSLRT